MDNEPGERNMQDIHNILVAVDKSGSALRAAKYVADMIDGNPSFQVQLLHLELPPRMLEWGGSEDPDVEDQVSEERAQAYTQMEQQVAVKTQSLFDRLRAIFAPRGTHVTGRYLEFQEPLDAESTTKAILDAAKEHGCGTVVVGRKSFSGLQSLFQHHVAEELIGDDGGIAVWVVE